MSHEELSGLESVVITTDTEQHHAPADNSKSVLSDCLPPLFLLSHK